MAVRTTAEDVKAILVEAKQYDNNTSPSLTPFIATASALVDEVVTCATDKGVTHSATLLELVERWLAAHFYLHADQPFSSKSTGGASASFQGQTGMGLESTQYGQTAMILDKSGCLRNFNAGARAGVDWLGLAPSEQTDYEDRD